MQNFAGLLSAKLESPIASHCVYFFCKRKKKSQLWWAQIPYKSINKVLYLMCCLNESFFLILLKLNYRWLYYRFIFEVYRNAIYCHFVCKYMLMKSLYFRWFKIWLNADEEGRGQIGKRPYVIIHFKCWENAAQKLERSICLQTENDTKSARREEVKYKMKNNSARAVCDSSQWMPDPAVGPNQRRQTENKHSCHRWSILAALSDNEQRGRGGGRKKAKWGGVASATLWDICL